MDREELMTTLLSDSDDGEGTIYRKPTGASNGRNGSLMRNENRSSKQGKTGWMVRGALGLSFVLNLVLFILVVINNSTENVWNNSANFHTEKPCPPSSSSKSDDGLTNLNTQQPLQQQQQQQSQQQQEEEAAGASCAPNVGTIPLCGSTEEKAGDKTSEDSRQYENVFTDLTSVDIKGAFKYLLKERSLKVGKPPDKRCHVRNIELHTPNKMATLLFLDSYGPKPPREAQVILSCEFSSPPMLREIVVGPLPHVTYHRDNPRRRNSHVPLRFSPEYGMKQAYQAVFKEISSQQDLQKIMRESYGIQQIAPCTKKCITFLPQKTSSAYNDQVVLTITAYYATEFTTINPLDLIFVTRETAQYSKRFLVDKVFYGGQSFKSVPELIQAYNSGRVKKTRMTFPRPESGQDSIPGTMNLRGSVFPTEPKAGPKSFDPDGKRYSIKDQHVNYLQWSFNTRLSPGSGPQLWDVKWGGERIAYEISLQDVGVLYAGANPLMFYAHLSDSAFGLGNKASGLLPGLDCPEGATFLSLRTANSAGGVRELPRSQCVFEHNTERPLRRHRNVDSMNGENHGGLVDRVLIVRTVIVEYNYDYIFDMIFHQNGALELKTFATGYVMSQHWYNGEKPFGFKIHGESVGSIHQHIFNYKIDLDILGTSNRYESLDMEVDERPWAWYHQGKEPFKQLSFQHNLRKTEMDAVLRYNYSQPRYHIVYNDENKNSFGNHKAYRIATKGFSKQVLPDDSPVLNSRHWAKYDMLATRRRDAEETSSSIFSMFDGESPHVDIDRYLQNNETIVDEDLVFWITVGMHHIPHTEDIPNTPTIGTEAAILLTPYNYFRECPSVGSRDSIRMDTVENKMTPKDYGINWRKQCIPAKYDYNKLFSSPNTVYS